MNEKNSSNRVIRVVIVMVALAIQLGLIVWAIKGAIPPKEVREVSGYQKWSEEAVELAATLPVQDGGRVKPLSTYAGFFMLNLHGSRKMTIESGGEEKEIGPTELIMDALFRPELAKELPVFRVEDTEILESIGLKPEERRGRFSFNDIEPVYDKLVERGREVQERQEKSGPDSLSRPDVQIRDLANKVLRFQGMLVHLDFARETMAETGENQTMPDGSRMDLSRYSSWVRSYPQLGAILRAQGITAEGGLPPKLQEIFGKLELNMNKAQFGPPIIPPYESRGPDWKWLGPLPDNFWTPVEPPAETWEPLGRTMRGMTEALGRGETSRWDLLAADMKTLESLMAAAKDPKSPEFMKQLEAFHDDLRARTARIPSAEHDDHHAGEKIESEVTYYNRDYFSNGLVYFTLSFILMALGWLAPKNLWGKILNILAWVTLILGLGYTAGGIAHRSFLMERPPVGNLYDTIPFITAVAVLVFALAELMTRRRVMLAFAALMGMLGLFLASRFEVSDAKDHMDPLVAVLRSNFWLATHVVLVTIGYSGGLMACILSHVYVHLRLAGVHDGDPKAQRFYTRAVYGMICFTLFFSLVGTVLGGIWANDSWGRFWGWDPKENGALLIVIWSLIILHARLAGWIGQWGIHLLSIFMGIVVAFSWWGVNLLGVGLHNYGFIEGLNKINIFYLLEVLAILVGLAAMVLAGKRKGAER